MTRILFVDDEPYVLEALRMSLRRKRRVWDMAFVDSGAAALAEIERLPPDVVVTDMRMPKIDGAELLARVAALAPQAIRIILSGQMDDQTAARAVNVAHRFISKPCDSATLDATITRGLELRAWLASDVMTRVLGTIEALPSLPSAYVAIGELLRDPSTSIEAVAAVIQKDIGMAAKVLQVVNSSFFGLSKDIVNITQAVSYLGLQTMRNLVLAHSVFQQLASTNLQGAQRQQEHALASARIARKLLADARRSEAAETAAMLHDVGLLVLESRMPLEYEQMRGEAKQRRVPLHVIERERIGVTHAQVGAYLLGLWGLPHEIIDAVASHHDDWSDSSKLDTCAAVRVADAFAGELLVSPGERLENGLPVPVDVLERLGLAARAPALRDELARRSPQ